MDTTVLALFILSLVGMAVAFAIGHNAGLKAGLASADQFVAGFNANPALVNFVKPLAESVPAAIVDKLLGVLTILQHEITDPTAQQLVKDLTQSVDEVTGRPVAETVTTTTATTTAIPQAAVKGG